MCTQYGLVSQDYQMRIGRIVPFETPLIRRVVPIYRSTLVILDRFVTAGGMELSVTILTGLSITVICLYLVDKVALSR
jgi:hypothetical protein